MCYHYSLLLWKNDIIKSVEDVMKMISINKNIQSEIVFMTMKDMVPKESIFRKIDKYIDLTFFMKK